MSDVPTNSPEEELDLGEVEEEGDVGAGEAGDIDEDLERDPEDGPGDEDEDEEARQGDVGRAAQPARGGRRTQSQRLRERNERLEARLAELERRQSAPAQPQVDPRAAELARQQEEEFFATATPAQIVRYQEQKFEQRLQRERLSIQETMDKQAFDAAARSSALHRRYADQVEQLVRSEQAQGRYPSRETVLKYLIGEAAMSRAASAATGQRRAAQRRVAAAQSRPTGARSDAAEGRRPSGDSYEASLARLKGQPLW